MVEEEGRVVTVEQDAVWVETIRKSTCSSCSARNGCGQHLIEKYRSSKSHSYIRATCSPSLSALSLRENDRVVIGIPEAALVQASLLVYLLPLVSMIGSLWLASSLGLHDLVTALVALAGLGLGFIPVRLLGARTGDMCRVKVVRKLSSVQVEPELIPVSKSWSA